MRFGVARVLASCLLGSACAHHAAPHANSSLAPACSSPAQAHSPAQSRWREMTWAEYYAEVERHAWRSGATVIWIETPLVSKVPRDSLQLTSALDCVEGR
jgi:hypothetical protein